MRNETPPIATATAALAANISGNSTPAMPSTRARPLEILGLSRVARQLPGLALTVRGVRHADVADVLERLNWAGLARLDLLARRFGDRQ